MLHQEVTAPVYGASIASSSMGAAGEPIPASVAAVVFGTWVGLLLRVVLQDLYDVDVSAVVFPALYANFVGCIIMGVATRRKDQLLSKYRPLYSGITTGLAGSLTTFSSWNSSAVFSALGYNQELESPAERALSWVTIMLVGFAVAFFGYWVGIAVAESSWPWGPADDASTGSKEAPIVLVYTVTRAEYVFVGTVAICYAGIIVAAVVSPDLQAIALSTAVAPLGSLPRCLLGRALSKSKAPLGTLLCNVVGTAVAAAACVLQFSNTRTSPDCRLYTAVVIGFCGCLTTVSTLIVELTTLPRKLATAYALVTVAVAQALAFLIVELVGSSIPEPHIMCTI